MQLISDACGRLRLRISRVYSDSLEETVKSLLQSLGKVNRPYLTAVEEKLLGSVSLRSSDPKDAPVLRMDYLQSEADVRLLIAGIRLMRQLFQFRGFDEFGGKEIAPGAGVTSDAGLVAYIRETCSTGHHPAGTCKMGTDPMAVVDPQGKRILFTNKN